MSEADLSASESSASLTSLSTQSEIGTPPTTSTTPEMLADVEARALGEGGAGADGVEIRVMRYREGLYAYTVSHRAIRRYLALCADYSVRGEKRDIVELVEPC